MSPKTPSTILVVLPAYNAEKTLERTLAELPKELDFDLLLVDDYSRDNTVRLAHDLKIQTIVHAQNLGYGANQKTCYRTALKYDYEIIVMLHPDYQYNAADVKKIVKPIQTGTADAVMGSRFLNANPVRQGMPRWKWFGNRMTTMYMNLIFKWGLSEYHSGFRAFHRNVLAKIPFGENENGFLFDVQILFQLHCAKFRLSQIPTETRYHADASSIRFWPSLKYVCGVFTTSLHYFLCKTGLIRHPRYIGLWGKNGRDLRK